VPGREPVTRPIYSGATRFDNYGTSDVKLNFAAPILVVDDSATMGRIIATQLQQIGFGDVDVAQGGTTALEKMDKKKYALVISDWNMAPMTGLELLARTRSHEAHARTPFIMISAEADRGHVMAAKDAGANGYLVKPFTAQALRAKLESVLAPEPPAQTDVIEIQV
jgi:two-component system, chemotaxis family, chemotaxis protein CheY